jgi:hypothetical protein
MTVASERAMTRSRKTEDAMMRMRRVKAILTTLNSISECGERDESLNDKKVLMLLRYLDALRVSATGTT